MHCKKMQQLRYPCNESKVTPRRLKEQKEINVLVQWRCLHYLLNHLMENYVLSDLKMFY